MDKQPKMDDLIGRRFVNGGRELITGLDCWGLVMEVYRRYGLTIPDFTVGAFAFQTIDALAREAMESRIWERVHELNDKDVPLVVLMRMHPKLITHVGVYMGHNRIIHTMKMTGIITSRASALKSRIVGYYRYVQDNQHT